MKPKHYKIPLNFDDLIHADPSDYDKRKSSYLQIKEASSLKRSMDEHIELLLTSHMGEYKYDNDYGFVIWEKEFENMNFNKFNTHNYPREEIQNSIIKTINQFEPRLKQVEVNILFVYRKLFRGKKIKYFVDVEVKGKIRNRIEEDYANTFQFTMGPLFIK
jgi:predicted component of type VI protein secretion system